MEEGLVGNRKNMKRNKILRTIRYTDEVSRHDVKKITSYSMTTVLNTINDLLKNKLLIEEECVAVKAGRKPTWLHINPDGQFFIGVEFNANEMNCVVINFEFEVIYEFRDKIYDEKTVDVVINLIKKNIRDALKFLGKRLDRVLGIGIGLPGYVDSESGIGLDYPYIKGWDNVMVKQIIEKEFKYEVVIENNVNTLAVAYRWLKCGEISDDFVLVSMEYGMRIVSIIDNKLFKGNGGNAGEIGHMRLVNGDRMCSCGRKGCVDTEVSFKAIKTKIIERMMFGYFGDMKKQIHGDFSKISMELFVKSVLEGDQDAKNLLEEVAMYLGQCLAPVLATLNPRRVIVASRSGLGGKLFSDKVYKTLEENITPVLIKNFDVECITIEKYTGAIGAAMLIMEKEFMEVEGN
ncbi:ROK family transcriptional regulator [Clostridium sediminicola]|uniref:ROK family protein n=1 Tax=Clostridium sediminicola TaxID=3114879 RepID=UPI0031F1CFFE